MGLVAQHTSLTYLRACLGTTPACGPSSATTYDFVWTDRRLRDAPQRELGTPLSARLKWQPLSRMLEWCKASNRDALADARPDLLGPFILTYVQRVCKLALPMGGEDSKQLLDSQLLGSSQSPRRCRGTAKPQHRGNRRAAVTVADDPSAMRLHGALLQDDNVGSR